ncbi:HEAT repeat domain-containing protein [Chloroflexota bacterium]
MKKRRRKRTRIPEITMSLPVEEIIVEAGNSNKPLLNARLAELSNLSSEETAAFNQSWAAIETKQRQQSVHRLVELAEENLELNFDNIFKHCLSDPDDEVRARSIEGLCENEEAALITPLINMLEQDDSEKVQIAAAMALGKFAMLAEHKKLRSCFMSRIQEALLAVISNRNSTVEIRRRALEAAAPLSLPQVKTAITEAYQSQNPRLKTSSIYAMGKNCDPSWLPVLLKELADTDAGVRYEAASACGELEEEKAVPHLIKLVNDTDDDVRISVIKALGKIGGTQAKECLKQFLNSPDKAIAQASKQALTELETIENLISS